jgi:hypothetical protein
MQTQTQSQREQQLVEGCCIVPQRFGRDKQKLSGGILHQLKKADQIWFHLLYVLRSLRAWMVLQIHQNLGHVGPDDGRWQKAEKVN